MFEGKRVVLAVTGGIAAYKSIYLASLLRKKGAIVETILTEAAQKFVTPVSFNGVTGHGVYSDGFQNINDEIPHIYLSKADMIIVAPASKNEIAKLACGMADNLLTSTISATKSPVFIVPAMNTNMYLNPINQENLRRLKEIGYIIIEPVSGNLACGDVGIGKMREPDEIYNFIYDYFKNAEDDFYSGMNVIVTGGPTISKLDPVRIFTNQSSGKMGERICESLIKRGANVTYISYKKPANEKINHIKIETTEDMLEEIKKRMGDNELLIMSAAPLDYEFESYHDEKIKKGEALTFKMKRTPDILKTIKPDKGDLKVIGFAAESENAYEYGLEKLKNKGMDMIFINNILKDNVFGSEENNGIMISKNGEEKKVPRMDKSLIADAILDFFKEQN
ncbi:MAG: bifunctional phosphopantothenoylcysteine decarboxylase/phosphopantothenate--cysteine ligase CoaBC [Ezakiella sp.]|uniref:bifunctional phosphopantothenoylcysteine decarboxylase/phosphopantothenate--cysteine ligase CoaBC n=1 Tax=Ezakiella sp. TaxID=1935205 RepID=UPI0029716B44|nr:bifunctional phosphopantothenoylcysteine decarboxylase/phosphopantothenate--cysteine ligase CoaBC [Ezakiella sp.]MDD7731017.1 bifunctional phosphopantothenoylcysteine decarboxylase/phosphopantothenate--cysteine ligase CoaBC [Eubacteriales bacterium]MDY6079530.1 bifunctional phosphopantothenoylcysteine decarboxylase/phosphopantothenate--cysteine ligase CoaBC [Ezakiella sp.]